MYKGFFASIAGLLAGVGLALADPMPNTLPVLDEAQDTQAAAPPATPAPPPKGAARAKRVVPPVAEPVAPAAQPEPDEAQDSPAPEPPVAPAPPPPAGAAGKKRVVASPAEPVAPVVQPQPVTFMGEVDQPPAEGFASAGPWSSEQDACRFWVGGEYLLWWLRKAPMPEPLVTTGSVNDLFTGAIGQPNTRVLFGEAPVDFAPFSGGRVRGGYWLDCEHTCAFEASGFLLENRVVHSAFASDANGNPVLERPIFGINTGIGDQEVSAEASIPGDKFGRIDVRNSMRLLGAEANFLHECCCCPCCYRFDTLLGFRYARLEEDLNITDQFTQVPNASVNGVSFNGVNFNGGSVPPLSTLSRSDGFNTFNNFYGGQVGARLEYYYGRWFADVSGKVALGDTHEEVKISGTTTLLNSPQGPVIVPGGLLALRSNIGNHDRDQFSVVPEGEVRIGYHVTEHLSLTVGYNFLYWTDVVRPGDQVNRNVDVTQVPTFGTFNPQSQAVQPTVLLRTTDFWAQGLDVGVEFRY